jgi:hypothetical protein
MDYIRFYQILLRIILNTIMYNGFYQILLCINGFYQILSRIILDIIM